MLCSGGKLFSIVILPQQKKPSAGYWHVVSCFFVYKGLILGCSNLAITLYQPLVAGKLDKRHRATGVEFLSTYAYLGA